MPANMIIDPVAPNDRLTGSSKATVSAGPMPGMTPTAVPSITPSNANIRFDGCVAVARPSNSRMKVSMCLPQQKIDGPLDRTGRQRQPQPVTEQQIQQR